MILKNKIKICFVYFNFIPREKSDFATIVPIRISEILKNKAEIYILYSGNINKEKLESHRIKSYKYGFKKDISILRFLNKFIILTYSVIKISKSKKIDLFLNVWTHYLLFPLIIGAKLTRKKTIARIVGLPISPIGHNNPKRLKILKLARKQLGLFVEKLSLKMSSGIYVNSSFIKNYFIQKNIKANKIITISTGVDLNQFYPPSIKDKNDNTILFIGRLTKNKGIEYLIKSLKKIKKTIPDVKCIIIGQGENLKNLKKLCHNLNLNKIIQFRGEVPHEKLTNIYHNSDLLVIPSLSEGLPNVILEAFACGIPVIGSNVGEIPVLLANQRGITVPPKNVDKLAEAIITLLSNEKLKQEMGQRARKYVEQKHSIDVVKKEYIKMFNQVLNK